MRLIRRRRPPRHMSAPRRPARRAEVARDAARRLDHVCRQRRLASAAEDARAGPGDADRTHRLSRAGKDRGGEAALAEDRLLALASEASCPDELELAPDCGRAGQRMPGQAGRSSASSSSTASSSRYAIAALPSAVACSSTEPTSRIWRLESGRKTWWTTSAPDRGAPRPAPPPASAGPGAPTTRVRERSSFRSR